METEKYVRLNSDGTSEVITTTRTPCEITKAITDQLGKGLVRHVKRAFPVGTGTAQLISTGLELYAVLRLGAVKLHSHYQISDDKILSPVFKGAGSKGTDKLIVAAPLWTVPESMRLLFAARIQNHEDMELDPFTYHDKSCYLFAFDKEKRCYRIPLPNLFDDGAVCMGEFNGNGKTISDAFMKAVQQFDLSDWNADLHDPEKSSAAQQLFRFRAEESETVCVPFTGDWTTRSQRISTPVSMLIGGLL